MRRRQIHELLEGHGLAGKTIVLSIQLLIVLSLIAFSFETLPNLSSETRRFLRWFEIVTIVVFTLEYLLRIIVAPQPLRFIFSFFGVIDLLAILPFYLSTGFDLRSARSFRLLRLFRILKLARYNSALRRMQIAWKLARDELVLFFAIATIVTFLSGVGIYYFENPEQPEVFASIFHSLWWSIVSLTTVGYGDMYPVTLGGRLFTVLILIVGLGVVAVPTGIISSALTEAREQGTEI